MRVLIMDASQRAALACTRSLGRNGVEVVTADDSPSTLAGASKYSVESIVYPSPYTNPAAFILWAKEKLPSLKLDAVLPITEVTTDLIVRNREYWPDLKVPFASIEAIDQLSNKVELFHLAKTLDVPVPKSVVVNSVKELRSLAAEIGVPGVLKPARSRILVDGDWKNTVVSPVASNDELEQHIAQLPEYYFPALYQEFVPGRGSGVFVLYKGGKQQACFAHNRLREKPPEGGVSVLSESRFPDQNLLDCSSRLLNAVGWHGVAMVEYRVSAEQGAYLMEVNARFWGSLQLAIDAGIDFPSLLLELVDPPLEKKYREGVRLRWWLGDLDRLYIQFKNCRKIGVLKFTQECLRFFGCAFTKAKNETLRLDDFAPGIFELRNYFKG